MIDKKIAELISEYLREIQGVYGEESDEWIKEAFKKLGPTAVPALIDLLQNADAPSEYSGVAVKALGWIADEQAITCLIVSLADPNFHSQSDAAKALGDSSDSRAIQPLIDALSSTNSNVRWSAAAALGHFQDTRVIEPLTQALQDTSEYVVTTATTALKNFGIKQVIDLLLNLLKESSGSRRIGIIHALSLIGDNRAMDTLIAGLTDSEFWIRLHSVTGLARIGNPYAKEPLKRHLFDRDLQVRRAVRMALIDFGLDPDAPEPGHEMRTLSDQEVVRLADSRMDISQSTRMSELSHKRSSQKLEPSEEAEFDALWQIFEEGSLRKATAMVEAAKRGLRQYGKR